LADLANNAIMDCRDLAEEVDYFFLARQQHCAATFCHFSHFTVAWGHDADRRGSNLSVAAFGPKGKRCRSLFSRVGNAGAGAQ